MKKRSLIFILLFAFSFILTACEFSLGDIGINDDTNNTGNTGNTNTSKDYNDELNTAEYYNDLFDINNKVTIKINISEAELAKIQKDYQSDFYRKADSVEIKIEYPDGNNLSKTIEQVGIKMKGNTTRHDFYDLSKNEIFSLCHYKLSFQETFDDTYYGSDALKWSDNTKRENRKNRTFFSLSGLEVKMNSECDNTYARDIYASMIYKENGIYAQSTTLGIIDMNIGNKENKSGTLGVYKIYEPIDRIFIKRYFAKNNNDGDLYKCSWGQNKGMPSLNTTSTSAYGVDNSTKHSDKKVSYALKTNKAKSTQEAMKNFLNWINNSGNDLNASISTYMDENYFITWLAIMYITGDWDNFMYDSNNYYMYFDESNKCYFMPYDIDKTFGIQAKAHNMAYMTPLDKFNLQGNNNRSNLLKKTIDIDNSKARQSYLNKIKELSTSILNAERFHDLYETIYRNYKDDVVPTINTLKIEGKYFYHLTSGDPIRENDSSDSNNAYTSYFEKKLSTINSNC